jgi:hypothetical protein
MNDITITVNGDPACTVAAADAIAAREVLNAADYDPKLHELYRETANILEDTPVAWVDPSVETAYLAIRTAEPVADQPYGITD